MWVSGAHADKAKAWEPAFVTRASGVCHGCLLIRGLFFGHP